ncbi:hypothetical protein SDC9_182624 [bioreactor metagenome]|uniref:Uncharacterized protein n=1 Tax=bioreactor metagenome TaxID=1076179 RepID=A0A645HAH8_9ZZZZ
MLLPLMAAVAFALFVFPLILSSMATLFSTLCVYEVAAGEKAGDSAPLERVRLFSVASLDLSPPGMVMLIV